MTEVLHIVRRRGDAQALEQPVLGGPCHALLLVGDAVSEPAVPSGVRCFFWRSDAEARGVHPPGEGLADAALLDLIFSSARVVCW